jgi:hypothetical protein
MEDIIDLIATDSAPSEISASIKNALFLKSVERIDELKPAIASSMFDLEQEVETSQEEE